MLGFKKKKTAEQGEESTMQGGLSPVRVTTIPDIFYGGREPEIYPARKPEEAPQKKPVAAEAPVARRFALLKNKKMLYIGGGVFFLIAIGLISRYYIKQAFPGGAAVREAPTPPAATAPAPPVPVAPPPAAVATTTPAPAPTAPSLEERGPLPLDFPRVVLVDSVDLDADALTDVEEEVFDTDSGTWDTDGDGYYDGQEIVNLYNPKGFAPIRLIDSGLIREYVNPTWQYRVYYPFAWTEGAVDAEANQVLFSAATGDYVEVVAFAMEPGQTFLDWFSANARGQRFTDLVPFSNRFQVDGFRRQDNLVAYFVQNDSVFALIYHPGTTGFISFRHVMIMMVQGFRPTRTSVEIPEQEVLPQPVGTSETTVAPTSSEEVATTTEE